MGNICGKQESDSFAQPGRTLGSVPAPATVAPVPAAKKRVSEPPRTLGGAPSGPSSGPDDPAKRAAAAALDRAQGQSKPRGKLGKELEVQRKQTLNATRAEDSNTERRRREVEQNEVVRAYD